ncbi:hypothetical protein [Amycolatopsis sp. lyj-84]|uniref:hypothetical protein n=1 Tax=Amycolatopsis sp. lyj-84 TaxID=2789284 RepID=UPI00397C6731
MSDLAEDLDLAEILSQDDRDTPIFTKLLAEYDADVLTDVCTGWPPNTTAAPAAESGHEPDDADPSADAST